jgi:hypothetical protein
VSDRAHALGPRPAPKAVWPADEIDAELAGVETSLVEWLARVGAWSAATASNEGSA